MIEMKRETLILILFANFFLRIGVQMLRVLNTLLLIIHKGVNIKFISVRLVSR